MKDKGRMTFMKQTNRVYVKSNHVPTHQAVKSQHSEHPFIDHSGLVSWMASSSHCQRFRGQEGITAKKEKEPVSQRRLSSSAVLSKYMKSPRILFEKKTDRLFCLSSQSKGNPQKKHILLLRLLFTRVSL
jgi:hypothetical protein